MDVIANLIKELRIRTGVSIVECKKSLLKNNGNIEKSIDDLRKKGLSKAAKINTRSATEGIILVLKKYNCCGMLELNCETDFVAYNKFFNIFGKDVLNYALEKKIQTVDILKKEFENKRVNLVSQFNENIKIRRFFLINNNCTTCYVHNNRIGVIVTCNEDAYLNHEHIIKNIAMHIAASNPKYIKKEDIPEHVLKREYEIQSQLTKKLSKNSFQEQRIIKGKMDKFIQEITLFNQFFIFDLKRKVKDIIDENNIKIFSFMRYELGEKIH
ncbi:elongation factor Ts [Buchnera aphidicola (Thelaxes californica)]|uniref:Elongation factor Ts n=1 Tax=Buchnera aphidicola (Thelaxes californica) TaxID=1315998 RepID=A0A4D6YL76_9GAMM|nr:translation elongation factor Ts [Buchnera aphidicola]QCI26720.1 elongation factor Ts [Buchnera aphidicola (Thelaxes californica)]